MRVGFVGLGNMGGNMTQKLAEAGYEMVVYDIQPDVRNKLAEQPNITVADSPSSVAEAVEVLFTCLPNDDVVIETYLEEMGILEGANDGLITCDCSTVSPSVSTMLWTTLNTHGVSHMDTPMLGSKPQAETGEIFFIVAGDKESVPTIKPLLDVMGKLHMYVGESGSGNQIKLIHNILGAANAASFAESMAACQKNDVKVDTYLDVVKSGGGMADTTYSQRRAARVLDREFAPLFSLELMRKDVTLALELAKSVGVSLPLMEQTKAMYDEACDKGLGKEDFSAITKLIEAKADCEFKR